MWHRLPDTISPDEERQHATRAMAAGTKAGYRVNIAPELFDEATYSEAMTARNGPVPHPPRGLPAPGAAPRRRS
ncbi:hypothetical protein [Streptomyces sp. TBY4]|uniref:hypothetical protein n=1 Tax=Streptomyces sp. TBY4 TaxID=2962030 RepID=UPI0020B8EA65|nr:hypothetical protein [Streptomyces sp. TBY4]MCP3753587.1 hypothetical protein [Streptomyces sp. TBY4]